jgi:hypothetical protein
MHENNHVDYHSPRKLHLVNYKMAPQKSQFSVFVENAVKGVWESDRAKWEDMRRQGGVSSHLMINLHKLIFKKVKGFLDTCCGHDRVTISKLHYHSPYSKWSSCKLYKTKERVLFR